VSPQVREHPEIGDHIAVPISAPAQGRPSGSSPPSDPAVSLRIGHYVRVLVITLALVAVAVADVIRRPQASWTSERERAAWLALLAIPVVVTLVSFSLAGPLLAVATLGAYCALRRGRAATSA
jgi:hypothetical protein